MNKLLLVLVILVAVALSGCVEEKNNTIIQSGENNTASIDQPNNIVLQSGEKIEWFEKEYGFIDEEEETEYKVSVFSKHNNVTRVIIRTRSDGFLLGYYVVYRE